MEWLDIIIMLVGCVIEIFLIYDYFNNLFELKVNNKQAAIIGSITCVAIFGVNLSKNAMINLVIIIGLLWTFVSITFDAQLGARLGYFVIAYIVMIGCEFVHLIMSETTADLLAKSGVIPVREYAWELLFIKLLNYIVFSILKHLSTKTKKHMTNKLFVTYLFVPITTAGTMFTVFYSGVDFGKNDILKVVMTLFCVFMVIGNIVLFYAFQKYTENLSENAKQQLEIIYQRAEMERLAKITELSENHNEMIHNTSHYLKIIGQFASENQYDEISNIVEELNGKLRKSDIIEYSNHRMLNTILSEYNQKAQKANLNYDAYVEPGCVLGHIKDVDLIAMLANVLDNAVLAATNVGGEANVIVRIFMQREGKVCIIKVVNDFTGNLKQVGGKLISTKKEKGLHGIGMSSIEKTAEQYRGYFEHYVENGKFIAILVLPN